MSAALPTRRRSYSAPALTKGLDIIEMLACQPNPMSLKDIADELGRSKSEIYRMLAVLEERRYVVMDRDTEKYSLTLRIFEIAHQHPAIRKLTAISASVMESLTKRIKQSCHLTVLNGNEVLVIAQHDSDTAFRFGVRLGHHVPVANSCSGHVFLAWANPAERMAMLGRGVNEKKPALSRFEVTAIVERVTRKGYEMIDSTIIQGVTDIGFPLFDHGNHVVAALIVPYLEYLGDSSPVSKTTVTTELELAAQTISRQMGGREMYPVSVEKNKR